MMNLKGVLSAEELLKARDPPKRRPVAGVKEFAPLQDKEIPEDILHERLSFLCAPRIVRSSSTLTAVWLPNERKAKVTQFKKQCHTFGHHNDQGDFLYPEEALFLLESNCLELYFDDVLLSIERSYYVLLNSLGISMNQYRVFAHMCRNGYKLVRHCPNFVAVSENEFALSTEPSESRGADDVEVVESESSDTTDDVCIIEQDRELIVIDDEQPSPKAVVTMVPKEEEMIVNIDDEESNDDGWCGGWYSRNNEFLEAKPLNQDPSDVVEVLSDDEGSGHLKKRSRDEILSLFPSASNGLTTISCPDFRLLPVNCVPKYRQYRMNLNFNQENRAPNNYRGYRWGNQRRNRWWNRGPRHTYTRFYDETPNNPSISDCDALIQKARELQAMAFSMLQMANSNVMSSHDFPQRPQFNYSPRSNFRGRRTRSNFPRGGNVQNRISTTNKPKAEVITLDSDTTDSSDSEVKVPTKRPCSPDEIVRKKLKEDSDESEEVQIITKDTKAATEAPKDKEVQNAPDKGSEVYQDSFNLSLTVQLSPEPSLTSASETWTEHKAKQKEEVVEETFPALVRPEDCSTLEAILNALNITSPFSLAHQSPVEVAYDVYTPTTVMKKTGRALPNFRLIVVESNGPLPSPPEMNYLRSRYMDMTPFLFAVVLRDSISYFIYSNINVPLLKEL